MESAEAPIQLQLLLDEVPSDVFGCMGKAADVDDLKHIGSW